MDYPAKPSVADLGIDPAALAWQGAGGAGGHSAGGAGGHGAGGAGGHSAGGAGLEIAFATARGRRWALMRVAGAPGGPVMVFDDHEWECFLDGAKRGEFDGAADPSVESSDPYQTGIARRPSCDSQFDRGSSQPDGG